MKWVLNILSKLEKKFPEIKVGVETVLNIQ